MTYVSYRSSRTRDHNPLFEDDEDYYSTRRLTRTNSKRAHADLYGNDEHDDYPYSSNNSTSSRALDIRRPSQLEKYSMYSSPFSSHSQRESSNPCHDASDEEDGRIVRYEYITARHPPARYSHLHDEDEREFRLKVQATFGRARSARSEEPKDMIWSSDMVRRKEKWNDEEWEATQRERGRRDIMFDNESVKEKTVRFRRVKRTRTNEWKPLSGWKKA